MGPWRRPGRGGGRRRPGPRRRRGADPRGGPAPRVVEVLPGHHPGRPAEDPSAPDGAGARGGEGGRGLLRSKLSGRLVRALTHRGIVLNTTSVTGCTALAVLARLRPRSLRFVREQEAIDGWLDLALSTAARDAPLAREIIECQQVLKGYGATYAHGGESFGLPMTAARALPGTDGAAAHLHRALTRAVPPTGSPPATDAVLANRPMCTEPCAGAMNRRPADRPSESCTRPGRTVRPGRPTGPGSRRAVRTWTSTRPHGPAPGPPGS